MPSMINIENPEIKFAMEVVIEAGELVRQVQAELVSPAMTKDDKSPVTVADYAAQALVAKRMMDAFPEELLVAEEDSADLQSPEARETLEQICQFVGRQIPEAEGERVCEWIDHGKAQPGKRYWTLDPIDGTKGFLRGGQYAVALALVVDGEVEIGALGCPNLEEGHRQVQDGTGSVVLARRGEGTWAASMRGEARFRQLQVSDVGEAARARLLRSFEAGHTNVSHLDNLASTLGTEAEPVRLDSQAKYAILAAGEGDLLFRLLSPKMPDYQEKIWDQAAGMLVVEEAGGRVSDLDGNRLDFSRGRTLSANRGVLASNGRLHEAALEAIKAVGA
ncbi:MAG: 3'(2'),5'-bisphosphate nucleotidase [Anaerolineae bacterium]|nr:3'(2'),5'-bisphosphate nucleotidase [Anaerolineae bacterium]